MSILAFGERRSPVVMGLPSGIEEGRIEIVPSEEVGESEPTGKVQGPDQIVTTMIGGRILHPLEEDSWLSREFEMTPMLPRPVTTISPSRATTVRGDPREDLDVKVVDLDSKGSPRDVTHSTKVQDRELALEQIIKVHMDSQRGRVESHTESR